MLKGKLKKWLPLVLMASLTLAYTWPGAVLHTFATEADAEPAIVEEEAETVADGAEKTEGAETTVASEETLTPEQTGNADGTAKSGDGELADPAVKSDGTEKTEGTEQSVLKEEAGAVEEEKTETTEKTAKTEKGETLTEEEELLLTLLKQATEEEVISFDASDASGIIDGSNIHWNRSGNTLTLSGNGPMPRYVTENAVYYPYQASAASITRIVVKPGVTYLSEYAFSMFPNVTSVSLPDGLETIGSFAFKGLTKLKDITIPSGEINESAFILCSGLETVTIGPGVTQIGISAFEGCDSLRTVNISDLGAWCGICFGGVLSNPMEKAGANGGHLLLNGHQIETLDVPDGVKSISDYAFYFCRDIKVVNFPASLQSIGMFAFKECSNLTKVNTPSGLKSIGAAAFTGTQISSFVFPSGMEYIGSHAFAYTPIQTLSIPSGYVAEDAFHGCGNMWLVNLGLGTLVANNAFADCPAIRNTIPDSTITIPATVTMGSYGGEAIEWEVLTVSGDKALIASSKVLDYQKFYNEHDNNDQGWAHSNVRTWLNNTFYNTAFSGSDKGKILDTNVTVDTNPKFGTKDNSNTTDKVFLLSYKEVTSYLNREDLRPSVASNYARGRNNNPAHVDDSAGRTAYYWLRTPGVGSDYAMYVDYYGVPKYCGMYTTNPEIGGIRPAMWVSASALGISGATTQYTATGGHQNADDSRVFDFVTRLYAVALNRLPDEQGSGNWRNLLVSGQRNGAEVALGFFTSQEMINRNLSNEDYVEVLYLVMMNRPSDAGGKADWVKGLDAGLTRDGAVHGFALSAEFGQICADYGIIRGDFQVSEPRGYNNGITQFVSRCYTKALGRPYDIDGLNDWCSQIFNSTNIKATAIDVSSRGFFESQEFLNKNLSNDDYVDVLYRTFLGREADAGGRADWVGQLNNGADRASIRAGFYNSPEFNEIMAGYGIR